MVIDDLEAVLRLADSLPREELPNFLGELEKARAIAFARLIAPPPEPQADRLLSVGAAAERLGVSRIFLYKNHKNLVSFDAWERSSCSPSPA